MCGPSLFQKGYRKSEEAKRYGGEGSGDARLRARVTNPLLFRAYWLPTTDRYSPWGPGVSGLYPKLAQNSQTWRG